MKGIAMIMTWVDAVNFLIAKGMKPVSESPFSDQNRVYFAYGVNDVFLDHSATVTQVGKNEFHVSDFSNSRKA
jgi:hypothetical protein